MLLHKKLKKNFIKYYKIPDCQIHHLLKLQGIHQTCRKVQECLMLANSISTINIMFNSMFNIFFSKQATTVQSNCIIFFPEYFEIPSFCKYIPSLCKLLIPLLKSQVHMKVIIKGWKNWKFLYPFFVCLVVCWEFWYIHAWHHHRHVKKHQPRNNTFFQKPWTKSRNWYEP